MRLDLDQFARKKPASGAIPEVPGVGEVGANFKVDMAMPAGRLHTHHPPDHSDGNPQEQTTERNCMELMNTVVGEELARISSES
jgi:hypothetical protein